MCKLSKTLAAVLAASMVMASLAGCGGQNTASSSAPAADSSAASSAAESTASGEPVKLRFSWWGGDSRHEATIAAAKLYMEKNPNVTIEYEYSGWDGYHDKLVTQLAGGTAADVIQINYDWIYDLRNQSKYFEDPRDLTEIDLAGFDEASYNGCLVNGELQGLPSGLNVNTLLIDKPFFEEHKLDSSDPTSWTWDKVLEEGIRVNKENPDHYLLNEFPKGDVFVKMILNQRGKEFVTKDYQLGCTKEDLVEALNLLKSFIDNKVMLPYSESAIYAEQTEQFPKWLNNEMGMFMQVASVIPSFSDMDLGVMLVPRFPDAKTSGADLYPTNIIAVNANGANKSEAAKFVNFFFNDPASIKALGDVRGVPPTKEGRTILETEKILNPLISQAIELGQQYPGMGFHPANFNSDLNKIIKDNVERFGYGEVGAEETADTILKELEAACAGLR